MQEGQEAVESSCHAVELKSQSGCVSCLMLAAPGHRTPTPECLSPLNLQKQTLYLLYLESFGEIKV